MLILMLTASTVAACGQAPDAAGSVDELAQRIIVDFDASARTASGRYFGIEAGVPQIARDRLVTTGQPARGAWRVDVLAVAKAEPIVLRVPLGPQADVADARRLSLSLIGDLADREVHVEIDDGDGGSTAMGSITRDQLHTRRWRTLHFPGSGGTGAVGATIRLTIAGDGPCWLAVDRVGLNAPGDDSLVDTAQTSPREIRQCLWVWRSERILGSPETMRSLIEFAGTHGFTDLFVQVPYTYRDERAALTHPEQQRALNALALKAGIHVHALDGHPRYVLRENHARLVSLVKAIVEFNRDGAADGRYHGVHLDNEPYVLPEWKSPDRRPHLIEAYLSLNQTLSSLAREAELEYGLDIPFWWDLRNASGAFEFVAGDADRTPILEAVFPLVDNLGVMSYRPRILGPNGVLACCETEFELGRRYGVDVFASIETGGGQDVEAGTSFALYPREHLVEQLQTLRRVVSRTDGAAGIAVHYYDALRKKLEEAE